MGKSFNDMSQEHLKKNSFKTPKKAPIEALIKNPMVHAIASSLPVKYKLYIGLALLLMITGAGTACVQLYNLIVYLITL